MSKSRKGRTTKTTSLSQKEQMKAYKKEKDEYLKKQTQIVKDALESEDEDVLPKTPNRSDREPVDDEMLAAVYLTAVNKQQPIDFVKMLENERRNEEKRKCFEFLKKNKSSKSTEMVKTQSETTSPKVEMEVPDDLKEPAVEEFFKMLEQHEPIKIKGRKRKILDRSKLPWEFGSVALAAYIAQVLRHDPFCLEKPYKDVAVVMNYTGKNLHASDDNPTGARDVDDVLERFNRKIICK